MKKAKFFKKFLLLILIVPVVFILSACGTNAYDVAVNNGFKGTEKEWLESLKGKSAYELALDNGFEGTEKEWLESLKGTDGTDGEDGKDAEKLNSYDLYEDAKNRGVFTGDYMSFLKTLTTTQQDDISAMLSKRMFSVFCLTSESNQLKMAGSAVLYKYNDDGTSYFITNYHMVCDSNGTACTTFELSMYDQTVSLSASLVGGALSYDIAVLKLDKLRTDYVKSCGATPVSISTTYYLGDTCYSIGNTQDYGLSATRGTISRDDENVLMKIGGQETRQHVFRHDSFISHGNSGGGIFDRAGNLIGITNGGIEETMMNYAIPASAAVAVAENVIKNGSCLTFKLGIEVKTNSVSSNYDSVTRKITVIEELLVNQVTTGGLIAAYNSQQDSNATKISKGDRIVSIELNGTVFEITKSYQIGELLLTANENDSIKITLERDDKTFSASMLLSRTYRQTL